MTSVTFYLWPLKAMFCLPQKMMVLNIEDIFSYIFRIILHYTCYNLWVHWQHSTLHLVGKTAALSIVEIWVTWLACSFKVWQALVKLHNAAAPRLIPQREEYRRNTKAPIQRRRAGKPVIGIYPSTLKRSRYPVLYPRRKVIAPPGTESIYEHTIPFFICHISSLLEINYINSPKWGRRETVRSKMSGIFTSTGFAASAVFITLGQLRLWSTCNSELSQPSLLLGKGISHVIAYASECLLQ